MPLYEKHRPTRLQAVVGQSATVSALQGMIERGTVAGAHWLLGASGTGKTTIARSLCNDLGVGDMDLFLRGGADCDVEFVRNLISTFGLSTWFDSGWKAAIIDEAQAITPRAVQALLPFLEALPAKRLILFTSNICKDDLFGEFQGPLFSRCKVWELSLDEESAAQHVAKIASDEGLNGQPIAAYRALLAKCEGNIRAALQRVEQGEMLCTSTKSDVNTVRLEQNLGEVSSQWKPHERILSTSAGLGVGHGQTKSTSARPALKTPSTIKNTALESQIAAEVERGKKFCVGSVKWGLHKDRLAELEAQR